MMLNGFTRSRRRSTAPGFTLDSSKEPEIQLLARRLFLQYTQGFNSQTSQKREHNVSVTHGHSTFQSGDVLHASQNEVTELAGEHHCLSNTYQSSDFRSPVIPSTSLTSPVRTRSRTRSRNHSPSGLFTSHPTDNEQPETASSPSKLSIRTSQQTSLLRPTRQENLRKSVALSNVARTHLEQTASKSRLTKERTPPPSEGAALEHALHTNKKGPLAVPHTLHMSSSDYRSSSSPPRSSSSPTPNTKGTTIRRSNRPRKEPATYDLKALSDLERVWISEDESTSAIAVTDNICSFNIPCQSQSTAPVPRVNFQKLLFERELRRGKKKRQIQTTVASSLKPWKRWKGASNDVCALAWSPDGTRFAAGATAHPDEYNRRNNLTLGDLTDGSLCELPDHWVPCPGSASSSISDDRLFTTMTAIQWAGDRLYTASYDHTIRIWDVESRHRPARVIRTLPHDSKVRVMCLSNSTPNLIATGTEKTFGLWRTSPEDCDPTYTSLPIQRNSRQKTHIDLEPTNLTWGGNAQTSHLLIGGMAEQSQDEYNVSPFGHLGMWSIRESSVELRKLSRDSQNIFDIKWHPNRPVFATASTTSPSFELPSRTRSVVQLYDIQLNDKSTIIGQFPCPAMDINELSFCPMDSVYMTASCTDGSTYIWDHRNPGKILHQLRHGMPQMPLNPDYSREVTDLGVKAALWGPTIDQFYTGGSDGFLKQWDIRRSPEDVLVANTTNIEEGIVSGAFSNDKSQLLLGDFSGAIHILSCGPYSDPEPADVELHFRPAPDPESSSVEQPGIPIAQELVSTGQLVLHPVYGPIQGPQYQGPWARWARGLEKKAPADMVQQVPLLPNIRLRQFDGPPALDRELDAEAQREVQCHFNLAHARHGRPNLGVPPQGKKRKRESNTAGSSTAELGSQRLGEPKKKRKKERKKDKKEKVKKRYRSDSGFVITNMDSSIIDLTMDSDEAADSNLKPSSSILPKGSSGASSEALQTPAPSSPTALKDEPTDSDEDYWWPDSAHVDANFGYEGV